MNRAHDAIATLMENPAEAMRTLDELSGELERLVTVFKDAEHQAALEVANAQIIEEQLRSRRFAHALARVARRMDVDVGETGEVAPEETAKRIERSVTDLHFAASQARSDADMRLHEIENMKKSKSWRVTAPLRRLMRKIKGSSAAFAYQHGSSIVASFFYSLKNFGLKETARKSVAYLRKM